MKNPFTLAVVALLLLTSCQQDQNEDGKQGVVASKDDIESNYLVENDSLIFYGELIYIPVYSSINYENEKKSIDLSITLSIHNTDPENSISVRKVNYHNTKGKLLKTYLNETISLVPFETINYVVQENDRSGGIGANFIIEWTCDQPVSAPIAESIMITTQMNQGISFTTTGRIIRKFGKSMVSEIP